MSNRLTFYVWDGGNVFTELKYNVNIRIGDRIIYVPSNQMGKEEWEVIEDKTQKNGLNLQLIDSYLDW
jgi:hypothetical protein